MTSVIVFIKSIIPDIETINNLIYVILADDIGILNHGRLLFEGSLEDLKFTAHEAGFENENLEEMFLSMIDEDNTNRKQRLKL